MRIVARCVGFACVLTLAVAVADELQAIPDLHARVTDLTNTLDPWQKDSLESALQTLEKRKGSQLGVLIVPTTQPEDIAQFSIRVFDAWKLGRKGIDDGALLIVAKNDHRVRIEVARGLEGAIPDAAAARIIREYITPKFRADDFYGGIHDATDALTKLIDGEQLPAPAARHSADLGVAGMVAFFLLFLLRLLFGSTALPIRAPAMIAIYGGATWFLTGWAGKPLTYSLIVTAIWAFVAFLVALIPNFTADVRYASSGGYGGFSGGSSSGSDSGSSSSSDSSSSDSSFSGGGGESAGGGASGSW